MNKIYNLFVITLVVLSAALISCQDDYDPIGNNKPVPVLKVDSKFCFVPATGGNMPIKINTNASDVEAKTLVSWLTGSYVDNLLTLKANANSENVVRETIVTVATVTGENEAQSSVRVIQGNNGMDNIFANMLRSELNAEWKVLKSNGEWKIVDNALKANSPGDVWSVMAYTNPDAKTVRSSTHKFRLSVDIKKGGDWPGLVFHAKDDKNFYILQVNIEPTKVFVIVDRFVDGQNSPMAMDPNNALSEGVDSYVRCEVVTTAEKPNDFTVNVYELKTTGDSSMNTDLTVPQKVVYTRTFTNNVLADGGFAGVCGKCGGGSFRRFVLTTN